MLRLELIEDRQGLRAFEPEWLAFIRDVPPPTPFQLPQWLLAWWRHFGSGKLHVMVAKDEDGVAGIIPCFLHEWSHRKQLTLMGTGISDYLDPVIKESCRCEFRRLVARHLQNFRDWEVCDWQDLAVDGALPVASEIDVPCSEIRVTESFEEFFAKRPKDLKRNLRRYREKAEAIGPLQFDVCDEASPELLDALIDLHGARWRKSGEAGMIEANGSAAFLREIAVVMARDHLLRIFSLCCAGRIAAVILAFRYRKTIFSYLSAFDPAYEAFGFGRELLFHALRHAHEEGFEAWNFLRGEEPYKFSWGAQVIRKYRVSVTNSQFVLSFPSL